VLSYILNIILIACTQYIYSLKGLKRLEMLDLDFCSILLERLKIFLDPLAKEIDFTDP